MGSRIGPSQVSARKMVAKYPKLKELHSLLCQLRQVIADKMCNREEDVLNYFDQRSTNASAESLNSKIKGFRAQLQGVADFPFFMYRLCMVLG